MRHCMRLLLAVQIVTFAVTVGHAIPHRLNYQGILKDGVGSPITTTTAVEFRIWDLAVGGTELWMETQPVSPDTDGRFNVILGSLNPIPDSALAPTSPFLGIAVPPDAEMIPRTAIVAVGFAYRVGTIHGALGGEITGNVSITGKATIGPGHTNSGLNAFVAGGSNVATNDNTVVSGGSDNAATGSEAVIGGGQENSAAGSGAAISGGLLNLASGDRSTIGGGGDNTASGTGTVVSGGLQNTALVEGATVSGGGYNIARGMYSVIGGGGGPSMTDSNSARGDISTIAGGQFNSTDMSASTVSGGVSNYAGAQQATVGGGGDNAATGSNATISGGGENTAGAVYATIGGGNANFANGDYSTVAGGRNNQSTSADASVGGGRGNNATGQASTVSGGRFNRASGAYATIAGGGGPDLVDSNMAAGDYSTISGGHRNVIQQNNSTIGGGVNNTISSGTSATIGGGRENQIDGNDGTIAGGYLNVAGFRGAVGGGLENEATGGNATVGGGDQNIASGYYGTVPGGLLNAATGYHSFAAGNKSKSNHQGSVVISANSSTALADSIRSGADGQMVLFADGYFYLTDAYEEAPAVAGRFINTSTGAYLTNGGTWTNSSDRALKENFTEVDYEELLRKIAVLPITSWNYKNEGPNVRHIGPTAQDFHDLFRVGNDDKSISTIDPAGIALAAIQALLQRNESLESKLVVLQGQIQALRRELNAGK